jgi:predicted MFS family arabinose efflux permease
MSFKEKQILYLLAIVNFLNITDFMIMMPMGPKLMRFFEISTQQFGVLITSYAISAGASGFLASFFIDQFDRKRSLILSFSGLLVGTWICALAPSFAILMSGRIIAGVFGGIIGSQVLSIVGDAFKPEVRGQATGIVMAGFSLASVLGVPLGISLSNYFNWHAPFLFVVGAGCIVLVLLVKVLPSFNTHLTKAGKSDRLKIVKLIVNDDTSRLALFFGFVLIMGHFSIIPFLAAYMVSNVGFSENELTYIYAIGGGLTLFTSPLVGKLADKMGSLKVFIISILISAIPVLAITNMPQVHISIALVFTSLFFVIAGGRFIPSQAMVLAVVEPKNRGGFMSFNSSMQQIAAGLGSYMAGAIVFTDSLGMLQHYNYVGYISVLLSLFCIYLAVRLQQKVKRDTKAAVVLTETVL